MRSATETSVERIGNLGISGTRYRNFWYTHEQLVRLFSELVHHIYLKCTFVTYKTFQFITC